MHKRFTIILILTLLFTTFLFPVLTATFPEAFPKTKDSTALAAENQGKFNMTYVYYGAKSDHIPFVDRTKGSLDQVAVNYFNLNSKGELVITDMDEQFIEEMHRRSIRVVAFLANHWDLAKARKAFARSGELSEEIAAAVFKYNLDGVNIDIENINENDRTAFTHLIKNIREELDPTRSLSAAVAVNPFARDYGWAAAYDYAELSKYCDYLMIMAYDESYAGSKPGPVASNKFVEDSIKYAVSQAPPEKIVLGIPFYGRYWKYGAQSGGSAMTMCNIEKMAAQFNGQREYFGYSQTIRTTVTIPNGKYFQNGSGTIGPGTYQIWYDDATAIKSKLQLVMKYGLKGTGSWSLGQESADIWDNYKPWLNGIYFDDVQGNWASQHINALSLKGIMVGTSKNLFSPDLPLTRAQAAVLLVRMLGLENEQIDLPPEGTSFPDLKGHWAAGGVEIARKYGIISGMGSGRFVPDELITREQMAVMLDRLIAESEKEQLQTVFPDVSPQREWSYRAIARMCGKAVFLCYPDGSFKPEVVVTRADAAWIINRVIEFMPQDIRVNPVYAKNP
ncbi:MAG: glycosyl hydrolase family 18 protein [Eubacteriales bacterium]|nr:glycosyl hydrolase family 18 protein [Eubacteriales bacterium]